MVNQKLWIESLSSITNQNKAEIFQGFLQLKSGIPNDIFFNNLGVLYEKTGSINLAKIFYLKSLNENLLNYQVIKNYYQLANLTSQDLNEFFLYGLYFLQSIFFLKLITILLVIISIFKMYRIFKEEINYFKLIKSLYPYKCILLFLLFLNYQNLFFMTKEKVDIFVGPSQIYKSTLILEEGKIVIKTKSNNGFYRIYSGKNTNNPVWIKKENLIEL